MLQCRPPAAAPPPHFCRPDRRRTARTGPAAQAQRPEISDTFEHFILGAQRDIIAGAEALDGSGRRFSHDRWERSPPNAGYGITSVLEGGDVLEKAAVNISVVGGVLSRERAHQMAARGRHVVDPDGGQSYSAAALSLVFHSAHPRIPTLRADVRLFEVEGRSWFGGGCDLTPFYVDDDDVAGFHAHWKRVCDEYGPKVGAPTRATATPMHA